MKLKYFLLLLIAGVLVSACEEGILDKENPNQFTAADYYKDGDQLTAATNAVYGNFTGSNMWGRMLGYFSRTRDDEHASGGPQLEVHNAQLLTGSYDNTNFTITAAWKGFYRTIHRANAVIEYGPAIEDIDEDLQKHRIAEAKFLRAYCYYYLAVNWGDVPLYTETIKSPDGYNAPAPEAEIYELIETDLAAIIPDLKASHGSADIGRATKGAARLLLARTLMHQGKYTPARTLLLDIYGEYSLVDNFSDNFREETEYNAESIFEIGFTGTSFNWWEDGNGDGPGEKANMMFQDVSPVGWRNLIPSNKLLDAFERPYKGDAKEDPRLKETVIFSGDTFGASGEYTLTDAMQGGATSTFNGATIKASFYKYSPMYKLDPGGYYQSTINYRNMRYAEVLIKLAECENEVGTPAAAIGYLNEIRNRASVDMPDYPTVNYPCNSKDEIYRAIMHESMVEFAHENIRVLDLARWRKNGKFSTLNPDPIGYIVSNPTKALLVYPNEEVSANPNL